MIPVNKIDVSTPRRAEYDFVALGASGGGMSGGIILAEVGFGLNDASD
jgi:hypothetical protein